MDWQRRRPSGGAAALCLVVVLVAACGPFLPPPTPSAEAATPTPAATLALAPDARLAAALASLANGYTFETQVSVDAVQAAHVSGRRYGGASELSVEAGGATVTYRLIPPTAWLMTDTGGWVEADPATASASGDPLNPLLSPESVEAAGPGSGGIDQLVVTYPASALGLVGTDPISVTVSIAPDGSITLYYEVGTATGLATSETVLRPAAAQDPILAPSRLPSVGG